jgi:pimeloyl-ACP methyl ester carboxylesterase
MNLLRRSTAAAFRGLIAVLCLGAATTVLAQPIASAERSGALQVERHGARGPAVILIPGLESGSWVRQRTIERWQKDHVVCAVSLAGFDGVPAPRDGNLFDRAGASRLQLIRQHKLDKPVLVGHSLGGTLALCFAGEHAGLIPGVVAVDGLPIFPGMERGGAEQRKAMAAQMRRRPVATRSMAGWRP